MAVFLLMKAINKFETDALVRMMTSRMRYFVWI